jgi:hypothetical protein
MTAVYPGGAPNTYVPSTEATGNMVVDFSRNVESFPINKYLQIVPVTKSVGLYTKLGYDEGARILQTNLANFSWADGDDEPSDRGQTETHEFLPYACKRYKFGFRIGELAADQAAWDILAKHARLKAQQAMTARTQVAITKLGTSGNWPTANTSAVSSITGVTGKWDVSTTARTDIKRSIDFAIETIHLATNGAINFGDFKLVMSPGCARKMSVSQEIVDFIKGSTDAKEYIGNKLGPNAQYGLPANLYGVEVVIENTVKVTSKKGATRAAGYVLTDTTPFIVSRPGSLVAPTDSNSAPNFSTACMFMLEEMTVQSKHDVDNRVHKGRVVENYVAEMTAGVSGFLFTAAVA